MSAREEAGNSMYRFGKESYDLIKVYVFLSFPAGIRK